MSTFFQPKNALDMHNQAAAESIAYAQASNILPVPQIPIAITPVFVYFWVSLLFPHREHAFFSYFLNRSNLLP